MGIKFPDFSVNRGKYSEPKDVLIPSWPNFGIVAFRVGDVPPSVSSSGITYDFKVEHVPCECNYSHSEVRTYKDGKRPRKVNNQIVKKKFRQILSERTKILREPVTP